MCHAIHDVFWNITKYFIIYLYLDCLNIIYFTKIKKFIIKCTIDKNKKNNKKI